MPGSAPEGFLTRPKEDEGERGEQGGADEDEWP